MNAALVRIAAALFAAIAMAPVPVPAQTTPPPLITDRPSFTSAARVVGRRAVQVESGVSITRNQLDLDVLGPTTFTTLEVPNALVRMGLSRRLELRLAMIGWTRATRDGPFADPSSTLSSVDVAGEYQFAAQERVGADLAVIAGASVPTQHPGSGDNTVDPFAQFVWSRDLTPSVDLGGMLTWSLPSSAGHRREVFSGSAVFGHPLAGRWSAFWEAVVGNQDGDDGRVSWTGNFGVLRAIGGDVQFDAFVGRGLNDAAADWAFGTGLSVRFRR